MPQPIPMDTVLAAALSKRLSETTPQTLANLHVVLLPDFFLDHFITITDTQNVEAQIRRLAAQGGGNYPHIPQSIQQGGNAANTALALARLGIRAHLICRTSALGQHLLDFFLGPAGVDLTHVKTDGALALTTALELGEQRANVMLGDPGSVADFSPELLTDQDYDLIATAHLVAVVNWNQNFYGTSLAQTVFRHAKRHHVTTFFDTGDPSTKLNEIPDMIRDVLSPPLVDILGLNENELRHYSGRAATTQQDLIDAAKDLKEKTPARLDLHTTSFSCSLDASCTVMPTETVPRILRATGAGDSWNAGNILATLLQFPANERLAFANLVAAYYISSADPHPPSLDTLKNLLKQ